MYFHFKPYTLKDQLKVLVDLPWQKDYSPFLLPYALVPLDVVGNNEESTAYRFICVNRNYKPIGIFGNQNVDYFDPSYHWLTLSLGANRKEELVKVLRRVQKVPYGFWFYSDADSPKYTASHRKAYFERLRRFIGFLDNLDRHKATILDSED